MYFITMTPWPCIPVNFTYAVTHKFGAITTKHELVQIFVRHHKIFVPNLASTANNREGEQGSLPVSQSFCSIRGVHKHLVAMQLHFAT